MVLSLHLEKSIMRRACLEVVWWAGPCYVTLPPQYISSAGLLFTFLGSAVETHLRLLDSVISAMSFTLGDASHCDFCHRHKVSASCTLCNTYSVIDGSIRDAPVSGDICPEIALD